MSTRKRVWKRFLLLGRLFHLLRKLKQRVSKRKQHSSEISSVLMFTALQPDGPASLVSSEKHV